MIKVNLYKATIQVYCTSEFSVTGSMLWHNGVNLLTVKLNLILTCQQYTKSIEYSMFYHNDLL